MPSLVAIPIGKLTASVTKGVELKPASAIVERIANQAVIQLP